MKNILFLLLAFFLFSAERCASQHPAGSKKPPSDMKHYAHTNHLINESSPYLLQHAHNPVNWYPWGPEALKKAKDEDKLLIISIGYSACHWCHVMEHESFEDSTVAKIMNDHFVCIKVDREERPDIDDVYMSACHLSGRGSCGWPLNAFATPDARPFWAGTYFPKKNWLEVLNYFSEMKKNEPEKIEQSATQIAQGMQGIERIPVSSETVHAQPEDLKQATRNLLQIIDFKKGGKNGRMKFPMPINYEYLLAQYALTGNKKALEAVQVTLDNMAQGGIYDQLGGGFSRYSTDPDWLVPHFEKMLYDNGQLVSLYANAWKVTQNPTYKKVVDETLAFTERELIDQSGGFYSSLDADSDGEEGKFYVWKLSEVKALLDEPSFQLIKDYYNLTEKGNWEHGNNILHITKPLAPIAKKHNLDFAQAQKMLQNAKHQLFIARSKRIRPGLDDKILTSWNALMLKGYVDAYLTFNEPKHLETALKNAHFLAGNMMSKEGRLLRNYKNGKASINAFLDDYALTAWAFMALYEATFDEQWINKAKQLTDFAYQHFYDPSTGLFFYTSDLDAPLVTRKKELSDNVIPASNSVMGRVLWKLGHYYDTENYIPLSKKMVQNMTGAFLQSDQPFFYANWLSLYSEMANPPFEVAIIGQDANKLRNEMAKNYLPNVIYVGGQKEGNMSLLQDRLVKGETRIYVCQNRVCKFPVNTVQDALPLVR